MEKTDCISCKHCDCVCQAMRPPKYVYTCTNEKSEFHKKHVNPFGTCEKWEALYDFFEEAEAYWFV